MIMTDLLIWMTLPVGGKGVNGVKCIGLVGQTYGLNVLREGENVLGWLV